VVDFGLFPVGAPMGGGVFGDGGVFGVCGVVGGKGGIMNIEWTKKAIEVMQAYVAEEPIQQRHGETLWHDVSYPGWNWRNVIYRVKPKPRVIYVHKTGITRTDVPLDI
jgi:hypothetical protein